jgi:hypothetical protein
MSIASSMLRLLALVALVETGCHSCSAQRASHKETIKIPINPPSFSGIELNNMHESACSPKVDESFRGLVIVTPDTVDLAGEWHAAVGQNEPRPVLPVCGTIQFTAATDARFLSTLDQILLIAVDAQTHASYVSNLVYRGFTPELPTRPTPAQLEEWKNRVYTFFFNANAFYYLEDLPAAPTRYHIFAAVGDIVSNVRTVEVVGSGNEQSARKIAPGEVLLGKAARPPAVAAAFRGLHIAPRIQRWPKDGAPVWIDGVAQLAARDTATLGVTPIQRAIVVTVSSGLVYRSWNLTGERATFVDDQERDGPLVRAAFGFEVSKAFGPSRGEGVYVMVSMGPHISNVVFLPPPSAP